MSKMAVAAAPRAQRITNVAIIAVLWLGLGILFTADEMLTRKAVSDPAEWVHAFTWFLVAAAGWIVVAPGMAAALSRRPLQRTQRTVALHGAAAAVAALVATLLSGVLRWLAFGQAQNRFSVAEFAAMATAEDWLVNLLVGAVLVGGFIAYRAPSSNPQVAIAGQPADDVPRPVQRFGDVSVDESRREVRRAGRIVPLRPKEYDLLVALLKLRGGVASRSTLLREVWGYAPTVSSRTVDTHIAALRRRLEDHPSNPRYFVTVRHHGYRLDGLQAPV